VEAEADGRICGPEAAHQGLNEAVAGPHRLRVCGQRCASGAAGSAAR